MNVVIPMAGDSKIFKDSGFKYNKNFTEINRKPLFQHVCESVLKLQANKFIFIVNQEDARKYHIDRSLKLLSPKCHIVVTEGKTAGAACSVLLAAELIDNEEELIINNGDMILELDVPAIIDKFRAANWDGGIITFESVHPRWSFVRLDENDYVIETAEKNPISNYATTGVYYFKHGSDFIFGAKEMIRKDSNVEGNYYVCPAYNEMILKQKIIGCYKIDNSLYHPLTTPKEVDEYEEYLKANERRGCNSEKFQIE